MGGCKCFNDILFFAGIVSGKKIVLLTLDGLMCHITINKFVVPVFTTIHVMMYDARAYVASVTLKLNCGIALIMKRCNYCEASFTYLVFLFVCFV